MLQPFTRKAAAGNAPLRLGKGLRGPFPAARQKGVQHVATKPLLTSPYIAKGSEMILPCHSIFPFH